MGTRGTANQTFAVILAGGVGSRFWPASTPERPKQLLPLGTDLPLIVDTVRRAEALVGPERVRLLTGQGLVEPFLSVLGDYPADRFWVEPEARGTGPALAWAASRIEREAPGSVMVSLHADHLIEPFDAFADSIGTAARAARELGMLVCLGVRPSRPETGYGYVEVGRELSEGVFAVDRFVEKPDPATAAEYLASGRHLWNSGIFVWRAADFLDVTEKVCFEMAGSFPALRDGRIRDFFDRVEPVSVDVGVLERADNVATVRAGFRWDDVGTWEAVARVRTSDESGNAVRGRVTVVDGTENIVWAESGRVLLFGVDGLVVVRSGDETLVTRRELAPHLKRALEKLEETEP